MLRAWSLVRPDAGVSQRSSLPVREDNRASRSPPRPASAGPNDAANTGGTVRAVAAAWLEVAATGWTVAGWTVADLGAGVPVAHPAVSATDAMARAADAMAGGAAAPRRAFLTVSTLLRRRGASPRCIP